MNLNLFQRKNFHGKGKKNGFFEGWYLKHQAGETMLSLIPAYHLDEDGVPSASIQVVTEKESFWISYPEGSFTAAQDSFNVKIGKNVFSDRGVYLNIKTEELTLTGRICYKGLNRPEWDIMGPFQCCPFMECNHGVVSMNHNLTGSVELNGKKIIFENGTGYIEKDWGTSFPEAYFWTQCSFERGPLKSLMLSVAKVPFAGTGFRGCIGFIETEKKRYRFATYLGARIVKMDEEEILLQQGGYWFQVKILDSCPLPLKSPVKGAMVQTIRESLQSEVQYRMWDKKKLVFDIVSKRASLEQMYGRFFRSC